MRQAALFGARNRDGWDMGTTILTALGMGNGNRESRHLDDQTKMATVIRRLPTPFSGRAMKTISSYLEIVVTWPLGTMCTTL